MSGIKYIPPEGLKALDNYSYKSGEYSILDNILNPFWIWCANLLPLWVAPNLVTFTGTLCLSVIFFSTLFYDPQLSGNAPPWVYVMNSLCVWLYQTLDAMDGKQARRTGTSSPLGQLFDHGCDALGTLLLSVGLAGATCQGAGLMAITILVVIQVAFFFAQWEEYHVHTMRTQFANFGVTEGQYLESLVMLCTGVFGREFWFFDLVTLLPSTILVKLSEQLGAASLELRHALMGAAALFPSMMMLASLFGVLNRTKTIGNKFHALQQLVPLVLMEASIFVIIQSENFVSFYEKYPIALISVFGILFTHLTNRIIIANVCRIEYTTLHTIMLPLPFVVFALTRLHDHMALTAVLAVYGAAVLVQYFHFVFVVNSQICNHLGIHTLRIVPKKQE